MSNIEIFPRLAKWLIDITSKSDNDVISSVNSVIQKTFEIEKVIPTPYIWYFRDQNSLDNAISNNRNRKNLNVILWENIAHNCEAFQVGATLKGIDLLKSAIRALNLKEFLASAVLARAVLEHAAYFTDKTTYILKNIRTTKFSKETVIAKPEFENEIARTMFGTRLEHGEFKNLPRQRNCQTSIDRLGKTAFPEHQELPYRYAFLCEVAHPNVIGNARFWSKIDGEDSEGRTRLVMDQSFDTPVLSHIIEHSLWALGWGAGMFFQSFQDMNDAKNTLHQNLAFTFGYKES